MALGHMLEGVIPVSNGWVGRGHVSYHNVGSVFHAIRGCMEGRDRRSRLYERCRFHVGCMGGASVGDVMRCGVE